MPTDFTDLLERTPAPDMHVDPYAVVSGGRRRRLRRRVTAAGAGLAVAAIVAAGAVVVPNAIRNADRPSPAATIVTAGTVTVPMKKDLFSFRLASPTVVEFGRVVQGTSRIVDLQRATIVNGQAWVQAKNRPGLVLGMLPATFGRANDLFNPQYLGGHERADGDLVAGRYQPYVQRFEHAGAAATFKGRVYTDENADVFGPSGKLPTITFAPADGATSVTLWVDEQMNAFGHLLGDEGVSSTSQLADRPVSQRNAMIRTDGSGSGSVETGVESGWIVGVAPAATSGLRVDFTSGASTITPLSTKPIDGAHRGFAVEYRGKPGDAVKATLHWTNPDGTTGERPVD